jgi:hypothetical protein
MVEAITLQDAAAIRARTLLRFHRELPCNTRVT